MVDAATSSQLKVDAPWPRLDQFLASRIADLSRTKIQAMIKTGQVRVNGIKILKPREPLSGGEDIQVKIPAASEWGYPEPENIPLDILHEDDDLIVLSKPAGLVTHPGRGNKTGTLVNGLLGHFNRLSTFNGLDRPGIVHRLDKDTSGIMVVAKNDSTHYRLAEQFEQHEVDKTYLALVWGTPEKKGKIESQIIRDPHNRLAFKVSPAGGRRAITAYAVRKYYDGLSLLEVRPQTGRTHQIRVHLTHLGHPVFGDALYQGVKLRPNISPQQRDMVARLRGVMNRQALHASQLAFTHPTRDERMVFEAPLPKDFQETLTILEEESGA